MRLQELSPNAEIVSKSQARIVNVAAAVGLQNVLKSNLGPKGTLKLLVGGAGQLKLTKDGLVLLKEMQIQHPTAAMIARTATAQDDVTGDGTTSTVLVCGSILQQADRYCREGLHARHVVDGLEAARDSVLEFLKDFSMVPEGIGPAGLISDRELLHHVALTSLRTKLDATLADSVSSCCSVIVIFNVGKKWQLKWSTFLFLRLPFNVLKSLILLRLHVHYNSFCRRIYIKKIEKTQQSTK